MTFKLSARSLRSYNELHPMLKKLVDEVLKEADITLVDGSRGRAEQEMALKNGFSKVPFGQSAHNFKPAIAMDVYASPIPSPIDQPQYIKKLITLQMDIIRPTAKRLSIPIRQGLDWNMNGILTDEKFRDYPHVELHPWRQWAKEAHLIED